MATPKLSVLLIEDQTAIRQMLASFIAAQPEYQVAGEAADAREGLRLLETTHPSVVVLDWMLPGGSGLEFLRQAASLSPGTPVLVFSANTTELAVRQALEAGAKGYIEKTASFPEFAAALKAVAGGKVYLGPAVSTVVQKLVGKPSATRDGGPLSDREVEVLRLVAEGLMSKEIADALRVSVRTVENHRAAISRKTGLRSVAQLTLHAYELGLVSTPSGRKS
jgi:DNA-binding NarL/FixJ family response regulator